MPEYLYPDICVIGAGPAGLAVAAAARAHGAGVIVVEREALGGNDLQHGTIPARALAESARRAFALGSAEAFGISPGEARPHLARVRDHIAELTATLSMQVSPARFEAIGARLLRADGKFIDRRTLSASGVLIRARSFVIATGSQPVEPDIPGLDGIEHATEATTFAMSEAPAHLAVIGGGPYGVELAQAYRRLGAGVTLIDPNPLPGADPELAAVAMQRIADEGVRFVRSPVAAVAPGIALTLASGETIEASHLLLARDRRPAIDDLDLETAGVTRDKDERQRPRVRPDFSTSNSRIFAIGDAAGAHSATLGLQQAELVVRRMLFGDRVRNDPSALPRTVFTDPEIAEVGLTEAMARAKLGMRFRVLRSSFGENLRARLGRRGHGLVKLVTTPDGRVLGAGVVGPEAAEIVSLLSFAVGRGLRVSDLAGFYAPHPTLAAIVPDLAREHAVNRRQNPVRAAWMAIRRVLP